MSPISGILLLLLPLLLGGVCNMMFVKTAQFRTLAVPIDRGKTTRDGKRLLGENKTWKGFFGMVVFTALWMACFEFAALWSQTIAANSLLKFPEEPIPTTGLVYGMLLGLAYVIFELPNSYVKRRLNILPGTNADGMKGKFFLMLDQIDSAIGCALVLPLMYDAYMLDLVLFILFGAVIHYLANLMLFLVGLKSQAG